LGVSPPHHRRVNTRIGRVIEAAILSGPVDPRLWRASRPLRRYLAATVLCGTGIAAATIASAALLAHIAAGVITDPATRRVSHWASALVLLAALWAARALLVWLQARLAQRGASAVAADLAGQLLRSVTTRTPAQLAQHRDDAAAVVTGGLNGLRSYFVSYLPALALAAILTPATAAAIAAYDVRSAAIVVITLPLIPVLMVLIGFATRQRSAAALRAMTTLQSRLLDLVAGIPTLRALGRVGGSPRRIAELAAAHRRSTMATFRIAFLSALVLELLATLGVALVAVSVGLRLVYGQMTLAAGLTALLLAPEVFWPLRRVGVEFHAAQSGKTAADKAFALIDQPQTQLARTRTVKARGEPIRLEKLSVATRDGFRPESLCGAVEPGRVTVMTGPNGAGKSTALQAILGLTPPTSGRVTVAGINIADLDRAAWWSQVAWLTQRPVLVPGTVRQNLELFGPLTDIDAACGAAGFNEVLAELPGGIATVIGRGGVGLSLGQRQRLGLSRALGSPAPVLLLDEPTAHLDAISETRALAAIAARARTGDTVLVVGHREMVLDIADTVVHVGGRDHAMV
jgi:ATP-binding cassette subfamily C protein CydD